MAFDPKEFSDDFQKAKGNLWEEWQGAIDLIVGYVRELETPPYTAEKIERTIKDAVEGWHLGLTEHLAQAVQEKLEEKVVLKLEEDG